MYHKISRPPLATNLPELYVAPRGFDRQMRELAASGLLCLPFADVAAAAVAGKSGFCLTFDDGFRNVFEHALPILQRHGLRAIQFIVAGLVGGEDQWDRAIGEPPQKLMNDAEIRAWIAAGQEIGAHTMTHPRLTRLAPAEAQAEISGSKKKLEDQFGVPIRHFCYPYGDCNARVKDWVGAAGYESAVTVQAGVNTPGGDPLLLRRFLAHRESGKFSALAGKLARAWRRRQAA